MLTSKGKLAAKATTKLGPATTLAALRTAAVTFAGAAVTSRAKRAFMRTILVMSIMLATLSAFTAGARAEGSWCAMYGTGGTNCGFYSFEQCQATVSGVGGFCGNNPFYGTARESRRQRRDN